MKRLVRNRSSRRRNAGYALLMVVFFGVLLLITALTVTPKLLTEGYREREKEMEWRGNQYKRGIKLYYRKTGRFPQSLDDLTKPKMGSLRFMRQAYKDPLNPNGSWRLIYVGPGGQLIGSLKHKATSTSGSGPGQNVAGGSQGMTGTALAPAGDAGSGDQSGSSAGNSGTEGATVIGGNIIGVGSKVNRASIKVLDGATNYREWEFIWDPTKDAQAVGQPGAPVGAPIGSPIGGPLNPSPGSPSSGLPGTGQPFGNPPQQSPPPGGQPQN